MVRSNGGIPLDDAGSDRLLAGAEVAPTLAPTLTWKPFAVSFTATSASTTIAFVHGDPPDDTSNFIDDVLLTAISGNEVRD
jgi:hypothetical protein